MKKLLLLFLTGVFFITAATADGVLTLTMPKAEHVKPYRVPVA